MPTNPTSEKTIEKELIRQVKAAKGMCLKLLPFQFTGLPDRLVLLPEGRMFFCETKSGNGQLRPRQVLVHRKLRDLGFTVLVINHVDDIKLWNTQ